MYFHSVDLLDILGYFQNSLMFSDKKKIILWTYIIEYNHDRGGGGSVGLLASVTVMTVKLTVDTILRWIPQ